MNIMLRMLMVILMLGSISAPAAVAMPMEFLAAEQNLNAEADADAEDKHACCPSATESNAVQTVTELSPSHIDCDNSCSDCQHFCHASSAGLLSAMMFSGAHPVHERSLIGAGAPHFSTAPLERPPHRS
jgi:hypothetical protein